MEIEPIRIFVPPRRRTTKVSGLIFSLATICNYKCPFCCTRDFLWGEKVNKPVSKRVVDFICSEYDFDFVKFTGTGETTLLPNFEELFFYTARHPKVKYLILYTNGVMMSHSYWIDGFLKSCSKCDCEIEILFSVKVEFPESVEYLSQLSSKLKTLSYNNVHPRFIGVINNQNVDKWVQLYNNKPEFVSLLLDKKSGYFEVDKLCDIRYSELEKAFPVLKDSYNEHIDVETLIGYEARDMNCVEVTRCEDGELIVMLIDRNPNGIGVTHKAKYFFVDSGYSDIIKEVI